MIIIWNEKDVEFYLEMNERNGMCAARIEEVDEERKRNRQITDRREVGERLGGVKR